MNLQGISNSTLTTTRASNSTFSIPYSFLIYSFYEFCSLAFPFNLLVGIPRNHDVDVVTIGLQDGINPEITME